MQPGPLTYTHASITQTGSSVLALAANTKRLYACFQNTGAAAAYLKFGGAAVAAEGIYLAASGGTFTCSAAEGNLSQAAVYTIGTNTQVLVVTEGQ